MDALSQVPFTIALAKAGLSAGTTTTISTTATVPFGIKGKAYSKTAITNGATPTTDSTTGLAFVPIKLNQGTVFVFGFDKTGAVNVSQGQVAPLDPSSGLFINSPQFPEVLDTVCPFGYLVAIGGATLSGTWTFGTNNLSSVTGMTYNFQDVITLPDRPQVA